MGETTAFCEVLGGKVTAKLGGMGKFFEGGLVVRSMELMEKEDDGGGDGN